MRRRNVQGQSPKVLTREESEAIGKRILGQVSARAAEVRVVSSVRASTEFARGDAHVASDRLLTNLTLTVDLGGPRAKASTTRFDEQGLRALVAEAEAAARERRSPANAAAWQSVDAAEFLGPRDYIQPPKTFFEATVSAMTPEARAAVFHAAVDAAEAAGLVGAGDVDLRMLSIALLNTRGLCNYSHETYGAFGFTARTNDGSGSGWSWRGYEDWARVDVDSVIARAIELGQRSAKAVAVEPGRHTVILEPSAVASLIQPILLSWSAQNADLGYSVFANDPRGTTKIGLQMMDRRLHLVSDPWDPELPRQTADTFDGEPLGKVVWFERGVLKNLVYTRAYARETGKEPLYSPGGARLYAEGPTETLEEMITSTRRGIWVTRLSSVTPMNGRTMLLTGTTRDGTFLIEDGKVTKAIKNLRFSDSPFFVLNKLEAFGEPVRASADIVAPRLKVRDFEFTSLTDAV